MTLEEKLFEDSISLFVFDVKKTPDNDFKIIEVSNPKTYITPKMNSTLAQYLSSEHINPLQKPVTIIRDKNVHPSYLAEEVKNIKGKNNLSLKTPPQKTSPQFDNYSQIVVDTSNESPQLISTPPQAFHVNNGLFHEISSNKLLSSYLLDSYSPLTASINPKNLETLTSFEGREVIAKSVTGFTSLGVRHIPEFSVEKLQEILETFKLTPQEQQQLGDNYSPLLDELFTPDMIQEYIPDTPLYSQTTQNYHTSVDRVAVLVTCNSGEIETHYIGGFHRFRVNDTPEFTPICLRNKKAFMEEFSPHYEEEIIDFTQKAFYTYYNNALSSNSSHYINK